MNTHTPSPSNNSRKSGSALLGVLALISAICFLAVIALQVLEMTYYSASPSLWPS